MKGLYALILLSVSFWAHAQKSPTLDQNKALISAEECKRIQSWRLIKNEQNLKISCGLDHLKFTSKQNQITSPGGKLRIGNFNLLHPGTDKTLFKDFGLVAELINLEFDVLAGIELVDTLSDARKNNQKLLPVLQSKFEKVSLAVAAVHHQLEIVNKIKASMPTLPTGPSPAVLALQDELARLQSQLNALKLELKNNYDALASAESAISENSKPGFVVFGIELFKKQRLKRLEAANKEKSAILSKLETLEGSEHLLDLQITALIQEIKSAPSVSAPSAEAQALLTKAQDELAKLQLNEEAEWKHYRQYSRAYRIPGYLTLLEKLQALDPAWSLVLSPHGDAADEGSTQELVGFYYRANRLKLDNNIHCTKRYAKNSSACYPNFFEDYMEVDLASVFSRRPFMATFNDGESTFTLMAVHVIFDNVYPEAKQKQMLQTVFGTTNLKDLGTGFTAGNYARFVEVAAALKGMDKLRAEGVERLIYMGDLNLEASNAFWKKLMTNFYPGYKLTVDSPTSLSESRFAAGKETKGLSNNYDHFILAEEEAKHCQNADHVDFVNGPFARKIEEKYFVRADKSKGPYVMHENAAAKMAERKIEMQERLEELSLVLVKDEVKPDAKMIAADMANFHERVFESQLLDKNYYKVFTQIFSDHLPIKMECEF